MVTCALNVSVPARRVAGDEICGTDPALRSDLKAHQVAYVLAIGCDRRVPTAIGSIRADQLTAGLPDEPDNGSRPDPARRPAPLPLGRGHPHRPRPGRPYSYRRGVPVAAGATPPRLRLGRAHAAGVRAWIARMSLRQSSGFRLARLVPGRATRSAAGKGACGLARRVTPRSQFCGWWRP
jgi:hypothetical protein